MKKESIGTSPWVGSDSLSSLALFFSCSAPFQTVSFEFCKGPRPLCSARIPFVLRLEWVAAKTVRRLWLARFRIHNLPHRTQKPN